MPLSHSTGRWSLALAAIAFGAASLVCSCATTNEKEAEAKRLGSLRESNPAAYEVERARSVNPATADDPNWPLRQTRR